MSRSINLPNSSGTSCARNRRFLVGAAGAEGLDDGEMGRGRVGVCGAAKLGDGNVIVSNKVLVLLLPMFQL